MRRFDRSRARLEWLYVAAAHGAAEVAETLETFDRILTERGAPVPAPRG